jgi:hypothetical protein
VVLLERPQTVDGLYEALLEALDHPEAIWSGSFQQLSPLAVRILLSLAIEPGRSTRVVDIEPLAVGEDPRSFNQALKVLEGSWVRIESTRSEPEVRLYDPSRRDFLLDQLESGPMFKKALSDASTIQQVEHLVKYRTRAAIYAHIYSSISSIDERATVSLTDSLLRAGENERARQADGVRRSETFVQRMDALTSAAALLAMLPELTRLSNSLRGELEFINDDFSWYRRPTSSALFGLAAELDEISENWALEMAERCVIFGTEALDDTEGLRDFANLPPNLRGRISPIQVDSAVQLAIEQQLDAIDQQSDRDTMSQWLDEVESVARDLGVEIYTSTLRERIDEMPEPPSRSIYQAVENIPGARILDDSDAALEGLFARLNDPDLG